ncbi:hypothetical protein HDU97_009336 [Phlyctochytrium planicorne]|nr:hypothetical protein HDU97_009336 [Phlyctochytrium planicorne]
MTSFPGYVYYPYNGGRALGAFYPPDCDGPAANGGCQINSTATNPNPKRAMDFCSSYGFKCKVVICWILELNLDTNCYLFGDPVDLITGDKNQYAYVKGAIKVSNEDRNNQAKNNFIRESSRCNAIHYTTSNPATDYTPTPPSPSQGSTSSTSGTFIPETTKTDSLSETPKPSSEASLSSSTYFSSFMSPKPTGNQQPNLPSQSASSDNGSSWQSSIITSPQFLISFAVFMVVASVVVLTVSWRVRRSRLRKSWKKKQDLPMASTDSVNSTASHEVFPEHGSNTGHLPSYDETVVGRSTSGEAFEVTDIERGNGSGLGQKLFDIPVNLDVKSGPLFSDDIK